LPEVRVIVEPVLSSRGRVIKAKPQKDDLYYYPKKAEAQISKSQPTAVSKAKPKQGSDCKNLFSPAKPKTSNKRKME
jgi:hypothetical protein